MAKYAELPDGTRLEFPDDVKESVMDAVVAQHMASQIKPQQASKAQEPTPSYYESLARQFGLGTRHAVQGLLDLPDVAASPVRYGLNKLNEALGGAPDYFKPTAEAIPAALGLPEAKTAGEREMGALIRGASGALPTLGIGAAMQAAGKAPAIASALTTMPRLQVLSGATGGGATGLAQEAGSGPVGQIAAGLAGSVLPGMAGASASTLGRGFRSTAGALDRLTPGGQERLAGTALERFASDPARARQLAQEGGGVLVEGSQPTLAQLTGDPRLAVFEKAMQSTPQGAEIRGRYTAQQEAQREALNSLLDPVQARQQAAIAEVPERLRAAAPYGGSLDERAAGQMIRGAFDEEYGKMRKAVSEAYRNIDPEGKARIDGKPLLDRWMQELDPDDLDDLPPLARKELGRLYEAAEGGNITFERLQKARARLSSAEESVVNSDKNAARLAGIMKRSLDDFIEGAALPEAQAEAFQKAKAMRRAQGERFEQGANLPLTRRGEMFGGQAIEESSIPGRYFAPGGSGSESMEALRRSVGARQEAQSAIADTAISTALRESTIPDGTLDPRRLQAFMDRYRPALSQMDNAAVEAALQQAIDAQTANLAAREGLASVARPDVAGNWQLRKAQRQFPDIPASAGLSPEETARLSAVQQDVQRALESANRAGVAGSPTAQLQRAMADLADMRMGVSGGGVTRNLINRALSTVTKGADENVERMLVNAVLDPEYAAKLMANTNTMRGSGIVDAARRWAGAPGQEPFADMLRRYGIATSISAGRTPAQAKGGR